MDTYCRAGSTLASRIQIQGWGQLNSHPTRNSAYCAHHSAFELIRTISMTTKKSASCAFFVESCAEGVKRRRLLIRFAHKYLLPRLACRKRHGSALRFSYAQCEGTVLFLITFGAPRIELGLLGPKPSVLPVYYAPKYLLRTRA